MKLKKINRLFRGNRRGEQEESDHHNNFTRCAFPILCGRSRDKAVIGTTKGTVADTPRTNNQSKNQLDTSRPKYQTQQSTSQTQENTSQSSGKRVTASSARISSESHKSKDRDHPLPPSKPTSKAPQTILRNPNSNTLNSKVKGIKSRVVKENSQEEQAMARMYDSIPPLEVTQLPRGGISIETEAIGRIQVSALINDNFSKKKRDEKSPLTSNVKY